VVETRQLVIDAKGAVVDSAWTLLADDAPLPAQGDVILPLARLLATPEAELPSRLGVQLTPADAPEALAALLPRLALVAVSFPKFRDGRGFTQARSLREHFGYTGEIRAVGHVIADQFLALLRCGVTTVELAQGQDPAIWHAVLALRGGLDTRPVAERALPLLRRLAAPIGID
jgi:uncharacterized protein (DUF934 family)